MFFLELLNHKSVFSVKWTDKSAKESVKHQLIHEAREAIDKTSFHALPLVTADVASWFKVQHFCQALAPNPKPQTILSQTQNQGALG